MRIYKIQERRFEERTYYTYEFFFYAETEEKAKEKFLSMFERREPYFEIDQESLSFLDEMELKYMDLEEQPKLSRWTTIQKKKTNLNKEEEHDWF